MQLFISILLALSFMLPNLLFSAEPMHGKHGFDQLVAGQGVKTVKCKPGQPLPKEGKIYGGVDGDTVKVDSPQGIYSVRLLGIDTPETHYMGQSQGEWGELAAARMQELLPENSKVTLDIAEPACDSHGRILAHVLKGGTHVNLQMAKEGLAVNYCVAPNYKHCLAIGRATKAAIDNREGMFSDPNIELPYDFRRRVSRAPQRSHVGDIRTKEVYLPGNQDTVPVANRVFFFTADKIQAPYRLVE